MEAVDHGDVVHLRMRPDPKHPRLGSADRVVDAAHTFADTAGHVLQLVTGNQSVKPAPFHRRGHVPMASAAVRDADDVGAGGAGLARRRGYPSEEIGEADAELRALVTAAAPLLIALPGVGPEVADQLLTTLGDNPERLHPEAAFAHLSGVAPSRPAADGPTATASTAAATGPPTTPSNP